MVLPLTYKKMRKKRLPRLMTINELSEYLGLQKQTIYNWLHQKKISGLKVGKVWRFDRKYIDEWLKNTIK